MLCDDIHLCKCYLKGHLDINIFYFPEESACFNKPCANDGVCTETMSGYYCQCAKGFRGHNCDGKSKVNHDDIS